jgi:hypothetical protein
LSGPLCAAHEYSQRSVDASVSGTHIVKPLGTAAAGTLFPRE